MGNGIISYGLILRTRNASDGAGGGEELLELSVLVVGRGLVAAPDELAADEDAGDLEIARFEEKYFSFVLIYMVYFDYRPYHYI